MKKVGLIFVTVSDLSRRFTLLVVQGQYVDGSASLDLFKASPSTRMDDVRASLDQEVLEALQVNRLLSYSAVVGAVILVYDLLLAVDLELKIIWTTRWSSLKFLYLLARYGPFLDTAVVLSRTMITGMSPSTWMYAVGVGTSEGAIRSNIMSVQNIDASTSSHSDVAIFVLSFIPSYWATFRYSRGVLFALSPVPDMMICMVMRSSSLLIICWSILVARELALLALLLIKLYRIHKRSRTTSYRKLILHNGTPAPTSTNIWIYGHPAGTLYFISLLILSTINLIFVASQPLSMNFLFAPPLRVVHSVIVARMMLHVPNFCDPAAVAEGGATSRDLASIHSLVFSPTDQVMPQGSWRTGDQGLPRDVDEVALDVSSWWMELRERQNPAPENSGPLRVHGSGFKSHRAFHREDAIVEMDDDETVDEHEDDETFK
ncbi:hypothetical protein HYDPIDRAFT_30420 [Hydnomerulius pinastri MD-312]|uniref:DUF6533 domain-containing protein n=1 Tax=Hydnomerulius pinastri MD-312 TaxID=994086 RepID=A0A0C9W6D0_9AGAM|nr:hypothetical protein HYDPIDRAFT_30420 [Hydnomerulius pinastri MD-312]